MRWLTSLSNSRYKPPSEFVPPTMYNGQKCDRNLYPQLLFHPQINQIIGCYLQITSQVYPVLSISAKITSSNYLLPDYCQGLLRCQSTFTLSTLHLSPIYSDMKQEENFKNCNAEAKIIICMSYDTIIYISLLSTEKLIELKNLQVEPVRKLSKLTKYLIKIQKSRAFSYISYNHSPMGALCSSHPTHLSMYALFVSQLSWLQGFRDTGD